MAETLDPETLARLTALEKKMTPADWWHQPPLKRTIDYIEGEQYPYASNVIARQDNRIIAIMFAGVGTVEERNANADAIVALRNAAPALLAAVAERDAAGRIESDPPRSLS